MPVHKVKGGYKWGKHGKVYPTRAGAERQARAAYAGGYTGKSEDWPGGRQEMGDNYASTVIDLAAEISELVSKAPGRRGRPGPDPKTFARKKTKEEHFAVHEDDSGERVPLPKERTYLKEGEEAPPSVFVQEGPRGGRFYEAPVGSKARTEEPAKEGAGSMAVVAEQPSGNPQREVKPTPRTSSTVEVDDSFANTLARIRAAMAAAKIPQAKKLKSGRFTPGYEVTTRDDHFEVYGRGRSDDEAKGVFRQVSRALENSPDLDSTTEEDHAVVEALKGDPLDELFGDEEIDVELDPLLSEKAWSLDEAMLASSLLARGVMPSAVAASLVSTKLEKSAAGHGDR